MTGEMEQWMHDRHGDAVVPEDPASMHEGEAHGHMRSAMAAGSMHRVNMSPVGSGTMHGAQMMGRRR